MSELDTGDDSNTTDEVQRRSELVLIIDAKDCNPNGDPLTADNEPRIDPNTGQCVVTDVRLKRYIRDQLADEDGHSILIANPDDGVYTREQMYERLYDTFDADPKDLDDAEIEEAFLEAATDVRYFGATISVDLDLVESLPGQYEGPVQFEHGRSYHEVERNTESKELATVIGNDEDAEQGTFATDHRIKFGVIGFGGRINEHAADDTDLTRTDVERLDTLVWRALKNQTMTRSKVGQQPRLYLRVEYSDDAFEIGRLNGRVDVRPETTVSEMRSVTDYALDVRELLDVLDRHSGRIETVYVTADESVSFVVDDETDGGPDVLNGALEEALSSDQVDMYDVYERYQSRPQPTESDE
jgi:CRISPR-associated protein Csh2